jgi:threonine dehydratase
VIAAEPLLGNHTARSLRAGTRIVDDHEAATIADGARTVALGVRNWNILKDGLAGTAEIPEKAIRDGVRILFQLANLKTEPTGALSVAALLADPERFKDKRVCCVISGGNVDAALYAELIG